MAANLSRRKFLAGAAAAVVAAPAAAALPLNLPALPLMSTRGLEEYLATSDFLELMSQRMAHLIIYGTADHNPHAFTGLLDTAHA